MNSPPAQGQNTRLGIGLMIATMVVFAVQDGISRHLAGEYNVFMVVMIRYWFFAAFAVALTARQPGGLARAIRPRHPVLQPFRGVLLVAQICILVLSFVALGLVETHAIFACYPLMVAALSGPILGEKVGWRRWTAIGVGFAGVLIILEPGVAVFSSASLVAVLGTVMFAVYSLTTRYVARGDPALVSFFWTGVAGAAAMTCIGVWYWQPMTPGDWGFMAALCCTSSIGHYLLIRAYEAAEASAIQPIAYLQLVIASLIGIFVFGETLRVNVALGIVLVVASGLFTLWRARIKAAK